MQLYPDFFQKALCEKLAFRRQHLCVVLCQVLVKGLRQTVEEVRQTQTQRARLAPPSPPGQYKPVPLNVLLLLLVCGIQKALLGAHSAFTFFPGGYECCIHSPAGVTVLGTGLPKLLQLREPGRRGGSQVPFHYQYLLAQRGAFLVSSSLSLNTPLKCPVRNAS